MSTYSVLEERLNIGTHAFGLIASLAGLWLLLAKALGQGSAIYIISFGLFGIGLVVLYAASTFYHLTQDPVRRGRMRIVDHAAIYVLIAGTYSPFTLVSLGGDIGWSIFIVSWSMALTGVILKLFFTGRYDRISTFMYVFMGWIIIVAIKPLSENLSSEGVAWLVGGGLAYTVGAILYAIKAIPMNHALFHVFVLLGSFSHFVAVYWYIPTT